MSHYASSYVHAYVRPDNKLNRELVARRRGLLERVGADTTYPLSMFHRAVTENA